MGARRRLLADAPPAPGHHHRQGAPASDWSAGYLNGWLSQPTPIFGLRLWVLICIAIGAAIVLVLLLILVCLSRRRRRRGDLLAANLYPAADTKLLKQHLHQQATPTPTKDIQEIVRRQQAQMPSPPAAPQPAVQLAKAVAEPQTPPPPQQQQHECHICGLGFEMGQALGGHMRRHREEMGAADAWVWRTEAPRTAAIDPPVLLELFA